MLEDGFQFEASIVFVLVTWKDPGSVGLEVSCLWILNWGTPSGSPKLGGIDHPDSQQPWVPATADSFFAGSPDWSLDHDTDSSSGFPLFSAVGLSLTMSYSWALSELPRTEETAADPVGNWPCSSPDILGNVELFESKGNKSFANVNTNDCGKSLVLKRGAENSWCLLSYFFGREY